MNKNKVVISGLYSMEPSDSFQGIESGVVEVVERTVWGLSKYNEDIEEFASVSPDMELTEDTMWVAYQYCTGTDEDTYVLPEDIFLEHATIHVG